MDEQTPEELLEEAVNTLAMGYPLEGSEVEKVQWLAWLRGQVESRAVVMRATVRPINRDN
jgi:hypothetical protein